MEGKNCLNCKYRFFPGGEEPCKSCSGLSNWGPQTGLSTDAMIGIDLAAPEGDKTNARLDWGESGPEMVADGAVIKAALAAQKNLMILLFEHVARSVTEFETAQREADKHRQLPGLYKYQEERELKRQRLCALWDVVEAAELVEDYERWSSQKP